jgi:hypothetical protein
MGALFGEDKLLHSLLFSHLVDLKYSFQSESHHILKN